MTDKWFTTVNYLSVFRFISRFISRFFIDRHKTDDRQLFVGYLIYVHIYVNYYVKNQPFGTRIATQVLKDGDLIEIDANRDIVRILEK